MEEAQPYDYIIVGAGAAGCVLADRLTMDGRTRVLLIEAGGRNRNPLVAVPMAAALFMENPKTAWHFPTEADWGSAHRRGLWVRGKGFGGSSAINGMLWCRGQAEDYDAWARDGVTGWSWADIAPCFRQIEDHELGDDGLRGAGGPVHISVHARRTPLTEALLEAGGALGLPRVGDLNRPDQFGIGYSQTTIRHGVRVSAADAFLAPALRRRNFTVITEATATRVLFDGATATGVQCIEGGITARYHARETILCAGTIMSPKLLMLSGIGPAAHLREMGIAPRVDLPGVGGNLREHKTITLQYRLRERLSHNERLSGPGLAISIADYLLRRRGPLATSCDVTGYIRSVPEAARADTQIFLWSMSMTGNIDRVALEREPGMMASAYPLRPRSAGDIRLRSPDPAAPPLIRPNFLADEMDRRVIAGAFRFLRRLYAQPGVARFIENETSPGAGVQSDEEIIDLARAQGNCFHATGTCKMGAGRDAVLDPHLRVRGVGGLRVVDASIMPTQVSGNTYGPVMALAWRASEIIKADACLH